MATVRRAWGWYMARGLVVKAGVGFLAFVLVLAPFVTDDPDDVNADAAPTATATATATATVTATATATATATKRVTVAPEPEDRPTETGLTQVDAQAHVVSRVVDGDTIELSDGESVRIVGIDTPERGECGYDEATVNMERLVLGKRVGLGVSDEDRDRYGRLLRYVDVGTVDAGLSQIEAGLAIARYDSRDGYGYHPREDHYVAADETSHDRTCGQLEPTSAPTQSGGGSGSAYYENCTAARDAGAAPVHHGDPGYGSHLDGDGDGVGCED